MYAAMYGLKSVLLVILGILTGEGKLEETLREENCLGNTALKLAMKNNHFHCYELLQIDKTQAIETNFDELNLEKKKSETMEKNQMATKMRRSRSTVIEEKALRRWEKKLN